MSVPWWLVWHLIWFLRWSLGFLKVHTCWRKMSTVHWRIVFLVLLPEILSSVFTCWACDFYFSTKMVAEVKVCCNWTAVLSFQPYRQTSIGSNSRVTVFSEWSWEVSVLVSLFLGWRQAWMLRPVANSTRPQPAPTVHHERPKAHAAAG